MSCDVAARGVVLVRHYFCIMMSDLRCDGEPLQLNKEVWLPQCDYHNMMRGLQYDKRATMMQQGSTMGHHNMTSELPYPLSVWLFAFLFLSSLFSSVVHRNYNYCTLNNDLDSMMRSYFSDKLMKIFLPKSFEGEFECTAWAGTR
jgi:hypothetical protein